MPDSAARLVAPGPDRPANGAGATEPPKAVRAADAGREPQPAPAEAAAPDGDRPAAAPASPPPHAPTPPMEAAEAPGSQPAGTGRPGSRMAATTAPPLPPPAESIATDRLPQILPTEPSGAPDSAVTPEPDPPAAEAAEPDPTLPALQRHAAAFTRDDRPMLAPILLDDGLSAPERARLAALPLAVSVALDPAAAGAAEAAAAYRAAGKEVVMLATQIPPHAAPSDLEVTFASHRAVLPQAVALLDLPRGGFQENRRMTQQVATILADDGLGLITHDRGLNPAAQVAARGGLPHALVFRDLAEAGGDGDRLHRLLERARFRAAQQGAAIVLLAGRDPELSALTGWLAEGRGDALALAPASAVLLAGTDIGP